MCGPIAACISSTPLNCRWHSVTKGGGGEDFAGGDHALLVGEADGHAGKDSGVSSFETGNANDGRDDEIGFSVRGARDGAGGAVSDFNARDT